MRITAVVGGAGLAIATSAGAQTFQNGNFETGMLDPWVVANTANGVGAPGSVTTIDIDGPGPAAPSLAATFMVGQATFTSGVQEGIEMIQGVTLTAGTPYMIEFDWSAQRLSTTNNAEGGVFSLIVDGTVIAMEAAGTTSAANPRYGHVTAPFTPPVTRDYRIGVRITRPYLIPGDLSQYVDNLRIGGGGPAPCYPDCNGDHALNVNDFVCFQGAFAGGQTLADCDANTVWNVNDFVCFQAAFAAGCSAL
jgi:hypothetical protein